MSQGFPLVFNSKTFLVNPLSFGSNALAFQKMYQNHQTSGQFNSNIVIKGPFSEKSILQVINLCQGITVPIDNSVIKETAALLKLFQAHNLFQMCMNYIHSNIDPSFDMSDNIGSLHLQTKSANPIFDEFQFDDEEKEDDYYSSHSIDQKEDPEEKSDNYMRINPIILEKPLSYEIKMEKRFLKSTKFTLYENGEMTAVAKHQHTGAVINKGSDVHFSGSGACSANITQLNFKNSIKLSDQRIKLKYFRDRDAKMTMKVIYLLDGKEVKLNGTKKNVRKKNKPLFESVKVVKKTQPCILYEPSGKGSITIRKTSKTNFTVNTNIRMTNVLAFALAISAIIGPHSSDQQKV
ncbi:hypothetical protein TRFO_29190 [Tritrichomonas foetus]|uniref:BTB domain-containing protein n=1 Tax=Tritrichomonas foetus TaxID=1144522 RepID=A0A1J4K0W4_9EUKA|nr:hypothetical protein TRFO_29190 [Tritrichomonas foetus]|eukprot:OHT03390.1 hypothetical protein TRFO_29190 [Tritrichomonas foetus]